MFTTDFSDKLAHWDRERKERLTILRGEVRRALLDLGATQIEAEYDGYGDSGNVNNISLLPDGLNMSDEVEASLQDFLWSIAYDLHPGFENNEGGDGEVSWDVIGDKINVEHRDRFIECNYYSHEDV